MEFQDNQLPGDRPNIIITLLIGLFSFGSWALKEIADRMKQASPDARIGITIAAVIVTVAGIAGAVALFVTAFSGPSVATIPALTPAAATPVPPRIANVATPLPQPLPKRTVDMVRDLEVRIATLKDDIASQQKEIAEAKKNSKEDAPALEIELRQYQKQLKDAELELKTLRRQTGIQ